MTAFAMGDANRGNPVRVFDWVKAAKIITERGAQDASAGLSGDWEWTGGEIFADGQPVPEDDTYVYLASTWAIPELDVDGDIIDCWTWQSDTPGWDPKKQTGGWGSGTYWPAEALAILEAEPVK
ncbi:uncharacterized protein RMCC_2476 [Mycolicibacterium canariasense]|uniref:Uncharacterized protein n=1 Tax=Mycolicibacterium canariasense TaxID=228230 RepID=A0A117I9Y3_MYCCR|nr:hypothetical protein [Mycolicibacterium canariasense]MCV7212627.1 hypothetical protein [Mycolicibacterium canariasense]ORV02531.1 hypothetical protein AWB94_00910 [Mycolicibacterium canariasense]GAS95510.1 uncharacterized protein RMCC_2476 [Mycolicibacterium canariasense]